MFWLFFAAYVCLRCFRRDPDVWLRRQPRTRQCAEWSKGRLRYRWFRYSYFVHSLPQGEGETGGEGGAKGVPSVSSKMLWKASLADSFPYHYLIPIIRTWSNTIVLSETLIIFVTLKGNWSFHLILTSFNHLSWRFYFIFISACKCIARGYLL